MRTPLALLAVLALLAGFGCFAALVVTWLLAAILSFAFGRLVISW